MEQILHDFVRTAASVLIKQWQAIDADRRPLSEPDRCDELTELSVELTASDEPSEMSARIAILDSAK
jgi:hypothetical protein